MRIAVVGAGAIGTYLSHRLHRVGQNVTVVARPEYVDYLSAQGLRVRVGDVMLKDDVKVVDRLLETPELVFLAVKTQDLASACEALLPTERQVTFVTLQNGVQADAIASSILGPEAVVGAVTMCAVSCLEPGVANVDVPGWFIVGDTSRFGGGRLRAVARTMQQAVPTFITGNLRGARWTKLIGNLTNGLSAASGLSLAELARSDLGRLLAIRVMHEGHRVVRAAGIELDHHLYGLGLRDRKLAVLAVLQALVASVLPILPEQAAAGILSLAGRTSLGRTDFRGSTWQSLVRGKPTEIEYLNGEIVRLGASIGFATPYNARVVEAVHAVENLNRGVTLRELCPAAR